VVTPLIIIIICFFYFFFFIPLFSSPKSTKRTLPRRAKRRGKKGE
jgi:hypothetical protein